MHSIHFHFLSTMFTLHSSSTPIRLGKSLQAFSIMAALIHLLWKFVQRVCSPICSKAINAFIVRFTLLLGMFRPRSPPHIMLLLLLLRGDQKRTRKVKASGTVAASFSLTAIPTCRRHAAASHIYFARGSREKKEDWRVLV